MKAPQCVWSWNQGYFKILDSDGGEEQILCDMTTYEQ